MPSSRLLEVRDRVQQCPFRAGPGGQVGDPVRAPPLAKKQAIIIQCPVGVGVTFPVSSITTSDVLG